MRLMIVGDTHADTQFLRHVFLRAEETSCDAVVILGDTGWWTNENDEPNDFFVLMMEKAKSLGIPVYWLCGNHENHHSLARTFDITSPVPVQLLDSSVYYCPRGSLVTFGDLRCMFVGGAYSIDRANNILGISWFEEEVISDDDVARSISNLAGAPVDIMFTHDTLDYPPPPWVNWGSVSETDINQRKLREIAYAAQPKAIFHGHWHHRYTTRFSNPMLDTVIVGLSNNSKLNFNSAYVVVDTETILEECAKIEA